MYFSFNIFSGFLLLQKCDIIQQLTRSEQLSILDKLRPMEYHPGDVVIRQGDCVGDEDDGLFIITKGELEVVDDKRGKLATIYQGHSFGEMALVNDAPRAASIVASTEVLLLALKKYDFQQICQTSAGGGAGQTTNTLQSRLRVISERLMAVRKKRKENVVRVICCFVCCCYSSVVDLSTKNHSF